MTDDYRSNKVHRTTTPNTRLLNNFRSFHPHPTQALSSDQSNAKVNIDKNMNPSTFPGFRKGCNVKDMAPNHLHRGQEITTTPLQPPIGHSTRFYDHQDRNRIPYSAALVGATAWMKPEQVMMPSSSSLATQIEASSSSISGDHPVKKCGATAISTITLAGTGANGATTATTESLILYIAQYVYHRLVIGEQMLTILSLFYSYRICNHSLPYIHSSFSLDKVKQDLSAHLSRSSVNVDNLKVRLGKHGRFNTRQVHAFATFHVSQQT